MRRERFGSKIIVGNVHSYGVARKECRYDKHLKIIGKKPRKHSYRRKYPHTGQIHVFAVGGGYNANKGEKCGVKGSILNFDYGRNQIISSANSVKNRHNQFAAVSASLLFF